ncbi:hypothetical protein NM688_g1914 [Phlebia brevispora]|uniref:Uncharacterized protein n=1 Tax=Phlebia brevispora TaxID=194682 RepID=A0ACC1TAF6_9APHY|nr:hypothetical protein NM688_g1914 [Phlebia brevispora]
MFERKDLTFTLLKQTVRDRVLSQLQDPVAGSTQISGAPGPTGYDAMVSVGPYHIVAAPTRGRGDGKVVMATTSELKSFTPFLLVFTIKDHDGNPVSNAQADWWQADTAGTYYHSTYALRGKFVTDAEGKAEVLTVTPGAYGPAGQIRAGHFHVIITPPGRKSQQLITQMYVCRANDPTELQTDILNRYRGPRPQNVLQCWCTASDSGGFMDLPTLPAEEVKIAAKVEEWNKRLGALDSSLHVVAVAQTEMQLSARSHLFSI